MCFNINGNSLISDIQTDESSSFIFRALRNRRHFENFYFNNMVKYFTEIEISYHKNPEDCWVSIFDSVFDISELIKEHRGILATPLINAAGTSISHWFNEKTGDLKTFIDPEKNLEMPYTPYGRFIHVPPSDPTDKIEAISFPWWKDRRYIIGKVIIFYLDLSNFLQ